MTKHTHRPLPALLLTLVPAAGCMVVSDGQLADWLDPDGDGILLADDCNHGDPEQGGEDDPTKLIDRDCDGHAEMGTEAAADSFQGETDSRTTARIAVMDGLGGVLVGPDSTGTGDRVLWLGIDAGTFDQKGLWNVDLDGPLGPPGEIMGTTNGPTGAPIIAIGFPQADVGGVEDSGCVVLLTGALASGEHTLDIDDCGPSGDAYDERLGTSLAFGWDAGLGAGDDPPVFGMIIGSPGQSKVTVWTCNDDEGTFGCEFVERYQQPEVEEYGRRVLWVSRDEERESGPFWVVATPTANALSGQLDVFLASFPDLSTPEGLPPPQDTFHGASGEQLGLHLSLGPPVGDDRRSSVVVESASRVVVYNFFQPFDTPQPWSIDDAALLVISGVIPTAPGVPLAGSLPDGIGTPADPVGWLPITGKPFSGTPCEGQAAATWLVPWDIAGEWTPQDADRAICLDDSTEYGVLSAMVSGGADAGHDHIVIGRPGAHSAGGQADLFTEIERP